MTRGRRNSDTAADVFVIAREYLHTYLPIARGASPATVQAYRIALESYLDYLHLVEHLPRDRVGFEHFDRPRLQAWLAWMNTEHGYKPATITLRLSAIRAFLGYAAATDITLIALHQGAKTLKAPPVPRTPIAYLTAEQTRAILAAYDGATGRSRRNRMLLILLYDTAARVSEITDLTLADLHLHDHAPHLNVTGKGNKTRPIPLTIKTVEHLRIYLAEFHPGRHRTVTSRPLFYSTRAGQPTPLSVDTVAAVLKSAAATARSTCPSIPAKIHAHLLRKTKAMDLYQQGIPMPIIMRLLGHQNATTTEAFYAFATMDMMRTAITAATPGIDTPAQPLTDHQLQALYSLR